MNPDDMNANAISTGDIIICHSEDDKDLYNADSASLPTFSASAASGLPAHSRISPATARLCEVWPLSVVARGKVRVQPATDPAPAIKDTKTDLLASPAPRASSSSSTADVSSPLLPASSALAALRQLQRDRQQQEAQRQLPQQQTPVKRFSSPPRALTTHKSPTSTSLASPGVTSPFSHKHPSVTSPTSTSTNTKAPAASMLGLVGSPVTVYPLPIAPVPASTVVLAKVSSPSTAANANSADNSQIPSTGVVAASANSVTATASVHSLIMSSLEDQPIMLFSPHAVSFMSATHTYMPIEVTPARGYEHLFTHTVTETATDTITKLSLIPFVITRSTKIVFAEPGDALSSLKVLYDLDARQYTVSKPKPFPEEQTAYFAGDQRSPVKSRSSAGASKSESGVETGVEAEKEKDALATALSSLSLTNPNCNTNTDTDTSSALDTPLPSPSIHSPSTSTTTAPATTLSGIGGLDSQITQILELLHLSLTSPEIFAQYAIKPPRGVLLHGPPGTGKTMLARALASHTTAKFFSLSASELSGKFLGQAEKKLRDVFLKAAAVAPSVVFVDEIDALVPHRDQITDEAQKRLVTTFLNILDGVYELKGVVLLAATNRPNALDPALRRPGRLDREIEIGIPTRTAREDIFRKLLSGIRNSVTPEQVTEISEFAHGYVGADIQLVIKEATLNCLQRTYSASSHASSSFPTTPCLCFDDLRQGLSLVRPSAMREVTLEIPDTRWVDIGGQHEVKARLQEAFEWPLLHPELFRKLGIPPPKGILLYGPPGCSKTLLAKALATECSRNFLAVKGPELFSKWVGDSEKAVREIFRKARAAAPAIIFFDEIDAIGSKRGSGGGDDVVERVLSQLLVELDGVLPLANVTILAATNRPDILDPALLRPGRIDRMLYVSPPDFESTKEIFRIEFRKMSVEPELLTDAVLSDIALKSHTKRLSGAEISSVCREAALLALGEDVEAEYVATKHFLAAVEASKARISPSMVEFYENYQKVNGLTNI
jgi:AAA family ATPase